MIPNLCITTFNRYDLLEKCILSIDFPIKNILIVTNSKKNRDENIINNICKLNKNIRIIDPGYNMGVAGSWNFFINNFINIDGEVYITQDDIEFKPGALELLYSISKKENNDFVYGYFMGAFIYKKSGFKKIGYFDENFYPAYYEDADFCYRTKMHDYFNPNDTFKIAWSDPDLFLHHGGATQTIKDDDKKPSDYHMNILKNSNYYGSKWGGTSGSETYKNPYNFNFINYKTWIHNYHWDLDEVYKIKNE